MTSSYRFRSTYRVTPNWFLRWEQKRIKRALSVANALLSQLANLYRTWFQIYVQNNIPVGSDKKVNSPHTMSWRDRRAMEVYLISPNAVSLPLYLQEEPSTQGRSGRVLMKRQSLVPPRIELRTFQPVVSRHTDYAILELGGGVPDSIPVVLVDVTSYLPRDYNSVPGVCVVLRTTKTDLTYVSVLWKVFTNLTSVCDRVKQPNVLHFTDVS